MVEDEDGIREVFVTVGVGVATGEGGAKLVESAQVDEVPSGAAVIDPNQEPVA